MLVSPGFTAGVQSHKKRKIKDQRYHKVCEQFMIQIHLSAEAVLTWCWIDILGGKPLRGLSPLASAIDVQRNK